MKYIAGNKKTISIKITEILIKLERERLSYPLIKLMA